MSDRGHLLPFPIWMIVLRAAQLVLAIIILGFAAYGVNYYPFSGGFEGVDLTMYTTIQTLITVVYIFLATFAFSGLLYNYWAILGLDMLGVFFWLVSFALLASEVANLKSELDSVTRCAYEIDGVCVYKRAMLQKRDTTFNTYYHNTGAAAGLGAVEFVLFVITLIFTGLWLHCHRAAGGHCVPASTNMGNNSPNLQRKPVAINDETKAPGIPMTDV